MFTYPVACSKVCDCKKGIIAKWQYDSVVGKVLYMQNGSMFSGAVCRSSCVIFYFVYINCIDWRSRNIICILGDIANG